MEGKEIKVKSPLRNNLWDHLGRPKDAPMDCAIFWDYASLYQKQLPDASGTQVDDRTQEMVQLFGKGLKASNVWYGHKSVPTLMHRFA